MDGSNGTLLAEEAPLRVSAGGSALVSSMAPATGDETTLPPARLPNNPFSGQRRFDVRPG